ncbi:hypothetical protein [uncultured Psychroserpens sp.]|uniref:hypothetical protein n=1 Tax=uncultured Psychroserpens sp. TaxID=255436 RepID=UPI00262918EA|nr:hypothetical protein [uncultured Psychroserpens sp.]
MEYRIGDFYDGKIGNYKLKKEYIFSYSFSPGLYNKLCKINLFVKSNLTYELFLFFYDQNQQSLESLKENPREARIHFYQESKLPFAIKQTLLEIVNPEFHLNDSYYNSKNTFGMLDRTSINAEINQEKKYFSIDLSLDTLDKNLFKTESELNFLKLIERTEDFLEKIRDFHMGTYE